MSKKNKGNRTFKDESGRRYGRLLVLARGGVESNGGIKWNCLCDCGEKTEVAGASLRKGNTTSCGCRQMEGITKHGLSRTPAYKSWQQMKQRCLNPKTQSFHRWGGRGIGFCDRWECFENFYEDMGVKPEGMSLDRINNNEGYSPANCRWATNAEQSQNTSFNVLNTEAVKVIKYFLKYTDVTQARLARAHNVSRKTISHIHLGNTWKNVEV